MSEENGFFMQYDIKWKIISEKQLYFALKFYCIASDILSNTFMVLYEDSNPQTPFFMQCDSKIFALFCCKIVLYCIRRPVKYFYGAL